jgi:hypothetical protein
MKRLDFSKVKNLMNNFIKNLFKKNKKDVTINESSLEAVKLTTNYGKIRGKNGFKNFTHILIPLNNGYPTVYRSFNKVPLSGMLLINGNVVYRVKLNPFYK